MLVSKRSSTCVSVRSRSGLVCANRLDLRDPFGLLAAGELGAEVEKRATRRVLRSALRCASNSSSGSKPCGRWNSARTSSFMGVKRAGFACAFERFEIQLGQVHAVPIEAVDQIAARPATTAREAVAIGQVHQLAPVELRVLQQRGLLAPLGMIVPELLADVRQFEPGVDQDARCDGRRRSGGAGIRRSAGSRSQKCQAATCSAPMPALRQRAAK